jgi:hypothetical protein
MRVSVNVFFVLSTATFLIFLMDHYYNQGTHGFLLLLVLGSLPGMTLGDREEADLQQPRGK